MLPRFPHEEWKPAIQSARTCSVSILVSALVVTCYAVFSQLNPPSSILRLHSLKHAVPHGSPIVIIISNLTGCILHSPFPGALLNLQSQRRVFVLAADGTLVPVPPVRSQTTVVPGNMIGGSGSPKPPLPPISIPVIGR